MTVNKKQGTKVASAATHAPEKPAAKKPIKPTVITTGPGVIIATATASTNCCSLNHWYSFTTPPYKKGTMARPLPNTKAPALVKNQAICPSLAEVETVAVGTCNSKGHTKAPAFAFVNLGGLFTNHTTTPDPRINQIFSSSVRKVVTASTAKIPQSNTSLPMLFVVSL